MRTLIAVSFITMFLVMTVLSASAAIDPNMILYFSFDEQLDGKMVEDLTGGGNNGKLKLGAKITNEPEEVYKGAGALKIFNNISAQFRVDEFDRMNKYGEKHLHLLALYIWCQKRSMLCTGKCCGKGQCYRASWERSRASHSGLPIPVYHWYINLATKGL